MKTITNSFVNEVIKQVIELAKNGTEKEKKMSSELLNNPVKMAKFVELQLEMV